MISALSTAGAGVLLVVLGLLRAELGPYAEWKAPRIVDRAADRLPQPHSDVRREEWHAYLDSMKGLQVFRLITSIRFLLSTYELNKIPSIRAARVAEKAKAEEAVEYTVIELKPGEASLTLSGEGTLTLAPGSDPTMFKARRRRPLFTGYDDVEGIAGDFGRKVESRGRSWRLDPEEAHYNLINTSTNDPSDEQD